MVRFQLKGGVWKNTEDEILKAAVMKYGNNQWDRISSLLVRKSAKQCKARWKEWLDPSIKKIEWSREEEEKLLHLAKLMPTQWRTIAPIVGRTASQCMEHYNKLLDAAQNIDQKSNENNDYRKLRPGEVDPNPENKPAKPDPIDMDEDDKEMLSEARARLANTRGKKAKRKAREKQLEEARRLASLQKKRELKAAGIDSDNFKPKRKKRGIDYNKEIPFLRRTPQGIHDVSEELDTSVDTPQYVAKMLHKIEQKRRDLEKRKKSRSASSNISNSEKNIPEIVKEMKRNQSLFRKRTKMVLPEPGMSSNDLEKLSKISSSNENEEDYENGNGNEVSLLSNYKGPNIMEKQFRTPLRPDLISLQAKSLLQLNEAQTPLIGGENIEIFNPDKMENLRTPNVLMTPLNDIIDDEKTPKRRRDNLKINVAEPDKTVSLSLDNLPEPKFSYEISIPNINNEQKDEDEEMEMEEEKENYKLIPDMADLIEMEHRIEFQKIKEEDELKSQVFRRNLPQPSNLRFLEDYVRSYQKEGTKEEEILIAKEMEKIIQSEINDDDNSSKNKLSKVQLLEAKKLIDHEYEELKKDKEVYPTLEEFNLALDKYRDCNSAQPRNSLKFYNSHVKKLENKALIYLGGYEKRSMKIKSEINRFVDEISQANVDLKCLRNQANFETQSIPLRIENMRENVNIAKSIHAELQEKYASLNRKKK